MTTAASMWHTCKIFLLQGTRECWKVWRLRVTTAIKINKLWKKLLPGEWRRRRSMGTRAWQDGERFECDARESDEPERNDRKADIRT